MWPRADRDELVHAPLGHGWSSWYSACVLERTWEVSGGERRGQFVFQDADGHQAPLAPEFVVDPTTGARSPAPGEVPSDGSFVGTGQGLSALFGVFRSDLRGELDPAGTLRLSSPFSPWQATFELGGQGRLLELRRKDHGRPLSVDRSDPAEVRVTDAQGRVAIVRHDPVSELVTQVEDPAGRRWDLSYLGHSLVRVRQQESGYELRFGYELSSYQLTRIETPDGLATDIGYRSPAAVPNPQPFADPFARTVTRVRDVAQGGGPSPNATGFLHTRDAAGRRFVVITRPDASLSTHTESASGDWLSASGPTRTRRLFQGPYLRTVDAPYEENDPGPYWIFDRDGAGRIRGLRAPGHPGFLSRAQHAADGWWLEHTSDEQGGRTTVRYPAPPPAGQPAGLEGLPEAIELPQLAGQPAREERFAQRNPAGEATRIEHADGTVSDLERSGAPGRLGLVERRTLSGGGQELSWDYAYDALGNLLLARGPHPGEWTRYAYDPLDRVVQVTRSDGSGLVRTFRPGSDLLERVEEVGGGSVRFGYDALGRLESTTPAGQGATTRAYDASGRTTRVTGPGGAEVRYAYADAGTPDSPPGTVVRVDELPDGSGVESSLSFAHDALGNVIRTTRSDALGTAVTEVEYDARSRPVRAVLPAVPRDSGNWAPEVHVRYRPDSRVERVVRDLAPGVLVAEEWDHDAWDRVVRARRGPAAGFDPSVPLGAALESRYEYGDGFRLTRVRGAQRLGPARAWALDPHGSGGRGELRYAYDGLHRRTRASAVVAGGAEAVLWELERDPAGRVVELRRPASELGAPVPVLRRRYSDATGQLLEQAQPGRPPTRYAYDSAGRLGSVVDPDGRSLTLAYDALGRVERTTQTAPDGTPNVLKERSYDPLHGAIATLSQRVGGASFVTQYERDAAGRLSAELDPLGQRTAYAYDARGRLSSRDPPARAATSYAYDALGFLAQVSYPDRSVTREDSFAGVLRLEDAGYRRSRQLDPLGRSHTETLSAPTGGRSWSFTRSYDAHGRLRDLGDPDGLTLSYRYDPTGQLARIDRSDGAQHRVRFDAQGRLLLRANPAGVSNWSYDAQGRVVEISGAEPPHRIVYQHDDQGRRVRADYEHLGVTVRWAYDGQGRLARETIHHPHGERRERFAYDEAGNRVLRERDGLRTTYAYNAFNQLTSATSETPALSSLAAATVSADSTSASGFEPALAIDGQGSAGSPPGQAFVSGSADTAHWLAVQLAQPTLLAALEVELPADRPRAPCLHLQARTSAGAPWEDLPTLGVVGAVRPDPGAAGPPAPTGPQPLFPTERLVVAHFAPRTVVAVRLFQPQAAGASLAVSELRAYTVAATTTTYDYDADGLLARAGSRLFQYDARGLLTHVVDVGQVDRSFVYGPGGQLLAEDDGAGGQRQHVTLGPELYASYDPNGVPTQKLLPGERLDFKAAVTPYAGGLPGETQYLFPDVQGTTHQVMTGADLATLAPGRLLETRLHSAFGEPLDLPALRQAGPPPPVGYLGTDFAYTGRRAMRGAPRLTHYRHRVYDAALGRFLTPDPLGVWDGLNRYAYVHADPVNGRDPWGLQDEAGEAIPILGGAYQEWLDAQPHPFRLGYSWQPTHPVFQRAFEEDLWGERPGPFELGGYQGTGLWLDFRRGLAEQGLIPRTHYWLADVPASAREDRRRDLMVLANQAWLVLDLVSFGAELGLPALARRAGLTGARLGSRVGPALPSRPPLVPAVGPMVDGVPVHANAVARGRFGELVVVHGPAGPGGNLALRVPTASEFERLALGRAPRRTRFDLPWSGEHGAYRVVDDFDPLSGTVSEATKLRWSALDLDDVHGVDFERFNQKLAQVEADAHLLRFDRRVRRVVWYGIEPLPETGRAAELTHRLRLAGIEYRVVRTR